MITQVTCHGCNGLLDHHYRYDKDGKEEGSMVRLCEKCPAGTSFTVDRAESSAEFHISVVYKRKE